MSNFNSGLQWDEPFGWAPTNWIAVSGLEPRASAKTPAASRSEFDATIDEASPRTAPSARNTTWSPEANVQVATGYKTNEIGFGWTNAVYLKMKELLSEK